MQNAVNSIKAKLFIIISENDLLVNQEQAKEFARLTNAKTLLLNNDCGHLAVSCEIDRCREEIANFLIINFLNLMLKVVLIFRENN